MALPRRLPPPRPTLRLHEGGRAGRQRGRWRLLHVLFPPYRPWGPIVLLMLGLLLAARGWPPPATPPGPVAYHAEPGAAAVLATPRDRRFGLNQAWEAPDAA